MVVFSNHRLGPSAELFVSDEVAAAMLRMTAAAARPFAEARWEVELVLWLDSRAELGAQVLDVSDIAWTPDHFLAQQKFVVAAIQHAAGSGEHSLAFDHWRRLVASHPAEAVRVGRRWQWPARRPNNPDHLRDNLA